MIFGAALLGPECRHGLSGERSSWLLFVVGLELPVPTVSVLPVSSVPEVFDRWSPGERSELIGSEFLDVLASVPDPRDPRGRRYSLMACWRSRFWPLPRGCAAMLVLPHGRPPLPMMCWPN
ncbi:Transposase for IS2404 [Mycobacterium liflandii 128FXT]|uniref:Transposase for IS2404 n=1 Tax=Mycobacterium liflandii (strain 128FXT) TaxID=459424 RepID=L7VDJ8_MYCL1|nr:Transposase for IS2404 [Mycobacterium liflandii 128FXT]